MKIALGNDHAGYEQREVVLRVIEGLGYEVVDLGTFSPEPVDYPDIAEAVVRKVLNGEADRGILICGTGIGMGMVANKFPGIRCSVCTDEYAARMARAHNNANVLALRGREIDKAVNERIVRIWLSTHFEGGRHKRRVDKITTLEEQIAREICGKD
ncbi:ribose 5-phosphate isomerase B [Candidatus Sumerlaeota bacterium]|nr:ribose 5-phosphate isomerase B [Candidatus Sumerlaeota bacterium]